MIHKVTGHNFHGRYCVSLKGPAQGFVLSSAQAKMWQTALCGQCECVCFGCYGDGPDRGAARVEYDGDKYTLIPAKDE